MACGVARIEHDSTASHASGRVDGEGVCCLQPSIHLVEQLKDRALVCFDAAPEKPALGQQVGAGVAAIVQNEAGFGVDDEWTVPTVGVDPAVTASGRKDGASVPAEQGGMSACWRRDRPPHPSLKAIAQQIAGVQADAHDAGV